MRKEIEARKKRFIKYGVQTFHNFGYMVDKEQILYHPTYAKIFQQNLSDMLGNDSDIDIAAKELINEIQKNLSIITIQI